MGGSEQTGDSSRLLESVGAAVEAGRLSRSARDNLERWLTAPHYAPYVPRLRELIEAEQFEELDNLFWEVIPFGTGGRRGPMAELGSATVNERTIAESAHGVAAYLKQVKGESTPHSGPLPGGERGLRAVVAHDTRLRSREFAKLTASTLAAHGLKVFCFDAHRSTPELSFAVRHLKCDAGVMISASHNPPSDNGFKAYWSHGGQVLPPHDKGIIDCVYEAGEIPYVDFDEAVADGRIELVGEEVDRAYVEAVLKLPLSLERTAPALFSPLHGVGETSVYRVLREAGFEGLEIFEPHRSPDGNFPNVPDQLPNPERPTVFDPLMERAGESGAELLLAADPDADRLGVCVRNRASDFEFVSGNRVGALLTDYVLRKRAAAGTLSREHYIVETLVTSPLIGSIGRAYDVRVINDLLVGFKYIAQTMDEEGPEKFIFGAEESLGYLAGQYCRDKDAAVAALYLMELAGELRRDGKTLLDRLDELFVEHGYYLEGQRSEVCRGSRGKEQIEGLMRTLRDEPPAELAGIAFGQVRDYGRHEIRRLPENAKLKDLPEPAGNLLFLDSAPGETRFSIAARPSGTEPKIKFYFFAQSDVAEAAALSQVKERTDTSMTQLQDALSAWVHKRLEHL